MASESLRFRGRTPVRLAFGTSGLRGLVTEITDLEAYINTRGFLDYLLTSGEAKAGSAVAVAGDLRPSTHSAERSILRAVVKAISDTGFTPLYCGRVPTPTLSAFAFAKNVPSVMVTGSHIPFDRNGIKFNKSQGEVLKSDEAGILRAVERVREQEYARDVKTSLFLDDGMFKPGVSSDPEAHEAEARQFYIDRYQRFFPERALQGLRLVMFEHSAVGRELVADILRALGAEVHAMGRSSEFVALDTEAVTPAQLQLLQELADQARAAHGHIDALISTDGDSDRPLIVGVDTQGKVRFFGGDRVGILTAQYLRADGAAVPISATDAIETHLVPQDVEVRRTQIGSPHVIREMALLKGSRRVGWEANGGFLTGSALSLDGRVIQPLPTRDAVLPIVAVLSLAKQKGLDLLALFDTLPRRASQATLIDAVPPEQTRALLARFNPHVPDLRQVEFSQSTQINGNNSRAQFSVQHGVTLQDHALASWSTADRTQAAEGPLLPRLLELQTELQAALGAPLGQRGIARINYFDGMRVTFDNADIVHLRASGNAPQLRIYVVSSSEERATELLSKLAAPGGVVAKLFEAARADLFVQAIQRNIAHTEQLFRSGQPAATLAAVCGSSSAQRFWQHHLDAMLPEFKAQRAVSLHEDLPVNQALGVLLLWQRLKAQIVPGKGCLAAFVFGEGTRATPFTETDNGQKPAMASFVFKGEGPARRNLSMVELAMRYFAPIEAHLRRSGFDGLVIKWGDEVQIPTCDLARVDERLKNADVVRFVSLRPITEDDALNKDWVGVDPQGMITAFIPRRPLAQMRQLASRGLLQERAGEVWGGINLGSIALSRPLLDALLAEFASDVNQSDAQRDKRPDLDPQFFSALTIAALSDPAQRELAWQTALAEVPAMQKLQQNTPDILERLGRALSAFESATGRPLAMVGLDLGEVFWGDIGQHKQIYEFYTSLNDAGPTGQIARTLAGITGPRDASGNWLVGDTQLGAGVQVENSVLIDCHVQRGRIVNSVLIGTRAQTVEASAAFDVQSTVTQLQLAARAGSYKVVSKAAVSAAAGERLTTLFLPGEAPIFRVLETTDLRDRKSNYDRAILNNVASFADAHASMCAQSAEELAERRGTAVQSVRSSFERS